jgi:hypothetical protein
LLLLHLAVASDEELVDLAAELLAGLGVHGVDLGGQELTAPLVLDVQDFGGRLHLLARLSELVPLDLLLAVHQKGHEPLAHFPVEKDASDGPTAVVDGVHGRGDDAALARAVYIPGVGVVGCERVVDALVLLDLDLHRLVLLTDHRLV